MVRGNSIKKHLRIAALATAFFIFWMTLGSIINFHQHHIFGRSLMPQGILSKREDTLNATYELPVHVLLYLYIDAADQTETLLPSPAWMSIKAISGVVNNLASRAGIPLFHGLRAPPLA